jgi:hypothetical protein
MTTLRVLERKGSRPKPPSGLQSILSSSVAVRGMKPSESKVAGKDSKAVSNGTTGVLGSPTNGENRERRVSASAYRVRCCARVRWWKDSPVPFRVILTASKHNYCGRSAV